MKKIKKLEFSEYVGNHASSSFTVGRVHGTNQIRYYIYKEVDTYRACDIQSNVHSFSSIDKAKEFCQKDFENFINNLIENGEDETKN